MRTFNKNNKKKVALLLGLTSFLSNKSSLSIKATQANTNQAPTSQAINELKDNNKSLNKMVRCIQWVKNHKLISGAVPVTFAAVAAAVGLTAWGVNRNNKKAEYKELEKEALEQEKMERLSILALCSLSNEERSELRQVEKQLRTKLYNQIKDELVDDIKKNRFKITGIIDGTGNKKIQYSNSSPKEGEDKCELRPLTDEVTKKYDDILNSFANILEKKKLTDDGNTAKDEAYITMEWFEFIYKGAKKRVDSLIDACIFLEKKVGKIDKIGFTSGKQFHIVFEENNQEFKIFGSDKGIRLCFYQGNRLITIFMTRELK